MGTRGARPSNEFATFRFGQQAPEMRPCGIRGFLRAGHPAPEWPNRLMRSFDAGRFLCVSCLVVLVVYSSARLEGAVSWPQFRGPNGSGVAERDKPPVEFG